MNLEKYKFRLEQIDQLIRMRSTGSPKAFSKKLGLSESQLYRILDAMKALNAPISYCKYRQTYYYQLDGRFYLGFECKESTLQNVRGGFGSVPYVGDIPYRSKQKRKFPFSSYFG
ncbi:MAG: hypothetical protein MRZ79_02705 [Bacteroidia bacterium]|nr:hypothetical protein [Bacteroidia bacterium]